MPKFGLPYALATFAYCAGIFALSSMTEPPDPGFSFPFMDKAVHALIFGGLAGLVSVGIRRSNPGVSAGIQWWAPIAFTVLYGMTDEIHQLFIPGRHFELADLLADAAGAFIAQTILFRLVWRAGEGK